MRLFFCAALGGFSLTELDEESLNTDKVSLQWESRAQVFLQDCAQEFDASTKYLQSKHL